MADKIWTEEEVRASITEDHRPWGKFREYPVEGVCAVKIITVNPDAVLSLQYHNRRSELWVVLDEGLEVTVGDRIVKPHPGDEVFIPQTAPHRLRGVGDKPARIMELWIGNSAEDDIVRIEDAYGRA